MTSYLKSTGLSAAYLKKLEKISREEEKSYYIHEVVRHSWTVKDLEKAIRGKEFQKRKGIGVAPSLADAGRRGKAVGCPHNTLQNDLRFSNSKQKRR